MFAPSVKPCVFSPHFQTEAAIDLLRREYAALNFLCDRHPMTLFDTSPSRTGVVKARDLRRHVGHWVWMAGFLLTGKVVPTRQGDPMEFITFEDETGVIETTFFPEVYRRFCHMLDRQRPYLLYGTVEEDYGALTLTVESATALVSDAPRV